MQIIYSPKFSRLYKKLPTEIKHSIEKKELLFRKDPFTSSLKTHKLTGPLEGLYAFSVDYSYRVLFEFADNDTVYFHAVGDHDVYK
jgi:mRNA interferase YafQ